MAEQAGVPGGARAIAAAFRGRVAVVSGAARGIGRAFVEALGRAGARVAILDVDASGAEALARDLAGRGVDAMALGCDVTDAERSRQAIEEVVARMGGVDLLVNNAGITHLGEVRDTAPKVVRKVMEVNFLGAVHLTTAALPSLVARKGTVVAVSSVAGFSPLYGRAGYAASKHALHGYFDTLRSEVGASGVRVVIACPSFTDTGIEERALGGDGGRPRFVRRVVGRPARPEDVAAAILAGAAAGRRLVVLGPVGKVSFWLSRLAPRLYERLMLRTQRA